MREWKAVAGSTDPTRPRVVVGIRDLAFHQEVLDHLERDPNVEVVASVDDPGQLLRAGGTAVMTAAILCPQLLETIAPQGLDRPSVSIFVVAQEMTVPILREAIDAGAAGVFAWPEERMELSRAVAQLPRGMVEAGGGRGTVIAVCGARGGAGTTFIACQLAASLSARSSRAGGRVAVADLDVESAGMTVALGIGTADQARTVEHLVPVHDELRQQHLEDALFQHPSRFWALLGPASEPPDDVDWPAVYRVAVKVLAAEFEFVILHLPRGSGQVHRAGLEAADAVVLVATQDLFSVYGARRILSPASHREDGRWLLLVNRYSRLGPSASRIARSVGIGSPVRVRFDASVPRAQDRGALLRSRGGGAARDVDRLARLLMSHGRKAGQRPQVSMVPAPTAGNGA
jgi:Flp pilus assembly CpaE family ATPase